MPNILQTRSARSQFITGQVYERVSTDELDSDDADEKFDGKNRVCGFSNPLRISWFFTITGTEYAHTYFWLAKDLSWTLGMRSYSIIFGVSALLWSVLVLWHTLRTLNWHEVWNFCALFLWLFANYWWMTGEVHDDAFPDRPPIGEQYSRTSAQILEIALGWMLVYYLIILPFDVLPVNPHAVALYDSPHLKPRIPVFKTFREYENLHTLLWIAKDLAWSRLNITLWTIALTPTLLVAADFICLASSKKSQDTTVDVVHYTAILLWVMGNAVWAFGDFFIQDYEEPVEMFTVSALSLGTARWYSSWILFTAIAIITLHYIVWIYLTATGRLGQTPSASGTPGSPASAALAASLTADGEDGGGVGSVDISRMGGDYYHSNNNNTNNNGISVSSREMALGRMVEGAGAGRVRYSIEGRTSRAGSFALFTEAFQADLNQGLNNNSYNCNNSSSTSNDSFDLENCGAGGGERVDLTDDLTVENNGDIDGTAVECVGGVGNSSNGVGKIEKRRSIFSLNARESIPFGSTNFDTATLRAARVSSGSDSFPLRTKVTSSSSSSSSSAIIDNRSSSSSSSSNSSSGKGIGAALSSLICPTHEATEQQQSSGDKSAAGNGEERGGGGGGGATSILQEIRLELCRGVPSTPDMTNISHIPHVVDGARGANTTRQIVHENNSRRQGQGYGQGQDSGALNAINSNDIRNAGVGRSSSSGSSSRSNGDKHDTKSGEVEKPLSSVVPSLIPPSQIQGWESPELQGNAEMERKQQQWQKQHRRQQQEGGVGAGERDSERNVEREDQGEMLHRFQSWEEYLNGFVNSPTRTPGGTVATPDTRGFHDGNGYFSGVNSARTPRIDVNARSAATAKSSSSTTTTAAGKTRGAAGQYNDRMGWAVGTEIHDDVYGRGQGRGSAAGTAAAQQLGGGGVFMPVNQTMVINRSISVSHSGLNLLGGAESPPRPSWKAGSSYGPTITTTTTTGMTGMTETRAVTTAAATLGNIGGARVVKYHQSPTASSNHIAAFADNISASNGAGGILSSSENNNGPSGAHSHSHAHAPSSSTNSNSNTSTSLLRRSQSPRVGVPR